jgi:hypothetical protein
MAKVSWHRLTLVLALLAALMIVSVPWTRVSADPGDPLVYIEQTSHQVYESTGFVKIRVKTTPHPTTEITVFYNSEDGSATAPNDYVSVSGQLTFPAGVDELEIFVSIVNDGQADDGETFHVILTNPIGADLGNSSTIIMIQDGNPPPSAMVNFEVMSWTVNENDGTALISVVMTGTPTGTVSVTCSTTGGGTAVPGVDYVPRSEPLTWQTTEVGVPKTLAITIIDNTTIDGMRSVNLALTNPVNATLGYQSTAVIYIMDDDSIVCPPLVDAQ